MHLQTKLKELADALGELPRSGEAVGLTSVGEAIDPCRREVRKTTERELEPGGNENEDHISMSLMQRQG